MRREDAMDLLQELNEANPNLRGKEIYPFKVKLLESLRRIASDTNPDNADAFVVHFVSLCVVKMRWICCKS